MVNIYHKCACYIISTQRLRYYVQQEAVCIEHFTHVSSVYLGDLIEGDLKGRCRQQVIHQVKVAGFCVINKIVTWCGYNRLTNPLWFTIPIIAFTGYWLNHRDHPCYTSEIWRIRKLINSIIIRNLSQRCMALTKMGSNWYNSKIISNRLISPRIFHFIFL